MHNMERIIIHVFLFSLFAVAQGCSTLENSFKDLSETATGFLGKLTEGKPIKKMTVSELIDSSKRVEYAGRMIRLNGRYEGYRVYENDRKELLKDYLVRLCDKSTCSDKFYLLWGYKGKFDGFRHGEMVEVEGYLKSLSEGTTVLGNKRTGALVAKRKSDLDYFMITSVDRPTPDYTGQSKIPASTVKMIQAKLKGLGYDPGLVDGVWGPKTSQALQLYQLDNGLHHSGELDEETMRVIVE